jgi:predicted outer membrane lipoprotein
MNDTLELIILMAACAAGLITAFRLGYTSAMRKMRYNARARRMRLDRESLND